MAQQKSSTADQSIAISNLSMSVYARICTCLVCLFVIFFTIIDRTMISSNNIQVYVNLSATVLTCAIMALCSYRASHAMFLVVKPTHTAMLIISAVLIVLYLVTQNEALLVAGLLCTSISFGLCVPKLMLYLIDIHYATNAAIFAAGILISAILFIGVEMFDINQLFIVVAALVVLAIVAPVKMPSDASTKAAMHIEGTDHKTANFEKLLRLRSPLIDVATIVGICAIFAACFRRYGSTHDQLPLMMAIALIAVGIYLVFLRSIKGGIFGPVRILKRIPFEVTIALVLSTYLATKDLETVVYTACTIFSVLSIALVILQNLRDERQRKYNPFFFNAIIFGIICLSYLVGTLIGDFQIGKVYAENPAVYVLFFAVCICFVGGVLVIFGASRHPLVVATETKRGVSVDFTTLLDQQARSLGIRYGLTQREIEVLLLIARSKEIDEICAELMVSRNTVQTHYKNIYRKLNIHSKQELRKMLEASRAGDENLIKTQSV